MPARSSFDYALIRVVPRVEREEFINVGAIVYCKARGFLRAAVELDPRRLKALWPVADEAELHEHLDAVVRICQGGDAAGPIGKLAQAERFHWLVAPRSTMVQTSSVHAGLCADPAHELEHLLATMVRLPDGHDRAEMGPS
jgi:hypothetical protein